MPVKKKTVKRKYTTSTDKDCSILSSSCQNKRCYVKKVSLCLAVAGLVASLGLWFSGLREEAVYLAVWVPTNLIIGDYCNKSS